MVGTGAFPLSDRSHDRLRISACLSGFDRRHRTVLATGHFDARAGAALDKLPGVALEIDRRSALAGRAGTGGAVILALKGDAVALLLVSSRSGRCFLLGQWRSA